MSVERITANNLFAKMRPATSQQTLSQQTAAASSTAQKNQKSLNSQKTKTIVLSAVALAALCGVTYWQRDKIGFIKKLGEKNIESLSGKITKLKQEFKADALRVLGENTHGNMVKLENIEPAAAMRSASPTEKEPFHQAASWIEEAYLAAYSRAKLSDGNNMFNYISKRIGQENNTLAQMYAQMPKQEAEIRIQQFADEIMAKDNHSGMTSVTFIKNMWEKFIPKAKNDLEALK